MKNRFTIKIIILMLFGATIQAQTGGNYTVTQSVIAGGGGTSADTGNIFSLDGAIGQAVTNSSSASPFSVKSGFFTAAPSGATAASVTIGGRVLTPEGRGLRNARVVLTDQNGNSRIALTTAFGYYRFAEVSAGETYSISVLSKRYQFEPQLISVTEELNDLNFTAQNTAVFAP